MWNVLFFETEEGIKICFFLESEAIRREHTGGHLDPPFFIATVIEIEVAIFCWDHRNFTFTSLESAP